MDIKPRPNHKRYVEILRRMTPEQRLLKSFELTEYARMLLKEGLKHRHPGSSPEELHHTYLEVMRKIHRDNDRPALPSHGRWARTLDSA